MGLDDIEKGEVKDGGGSSDNNNSVVEDGSITKTPNNNDHDHENDNGDKYNKDDNYPALYSHDEKDYDFPAIVGDGDSSGNRTTAASSRERRERNRRYFIILVVAVLAIAVVISFAVPLSRRRRQRAVAAVPAVERNEQLAAGISVPAAAMNVGEDENEEWVPRCPGLFVENATEAVEKTLP